MKKTLGLSCFHVSRLHGFEFRNGVSLVHLTHSKRAKRISAILLSAIGAIAFLFNSTARAADVLPGWGSWWLPPEHSAHGHGVDSLFLWIFWITMVAWIGV